MKKRLTLTNHLGNIVKEIISNKNMQENEVSELNETENRIFKFLEEIRSDGEINMLNSTPLIVEEFRQELLTDVICEMDDTEDFLSSTINRKVRNKAKSHLIDWIKIKIS